MADGNTGKIGGVAKGPDAQRFAVIIVHRNGAETLLRTLDALSKATDMARDRVFLVDNGSSDDSLSRVRAAHPSAVIIENGCNLGYAAAVNRAVPESRSAFVLVLNNDAFVPPELLDRFEVLFIAHPDAAVIGPRLVSAHGDTQRSFGDEPTIWGELGIRLFQKGRPPLPDTVLTPVDWISGACLAARRSAMEQAGSIDSGFFFYFEDVEWCIRLRRAGWRALLDRDTRVVHLMGSSTRRVRRGAQVEMLRSRLRFYQKVFGPGVAVGLGVVRFARLAINTVSYLLLTVLTLGLVPKIRSKLLDYGYLLAWWLIGRPQRWGLPDKGKL
ncbi:MAG: glycosyltransferase family 2 protein [Nitrospirota bacterium]|nr:glycosyltransferase family 2 protein [Nitrospirota bacterium]